MKFAHIFLVCAACAICGYSADAEKIIPVAAWPRVIDLPTKQIVNPSPDQCIAAGYRLLSQKPVTPDGKIIVEETIIQDPADLARAVYKITYTDKPIIPLAAPVGLTNVAADRVRFSFTTTGVLRAVTWIDAPVTNGVEKQ
jgi:hypothetical protein